MSPHYYEITANGHLDRARWSRWFDRMKVALNTDLQSVNHPQNAVPLW